MSAGRNCPVSYRYAPTVLCGDPSVRTGVLYVVGGLYGNELALDAVLNMFATETGRKHLIFNGDFNWFNTSPEGFRRINETVLSFDATRGNVETELAPLTSGDTGGGCGCAYPDWVSDDVVMRSNMIMHRLTATAARFPALQRRLAMLPMWKRIDVGGIPLGIVHGDAESLAGWGFAQEHLADPTHLVQVQRWFDLAAVRLFACSHTCLPVLQALSDTGGRKCLVINNGAVGMPNFSGLRESLLTRIATTPYAGGRSCYGTRLDGLFVDALSIKYDYAQWQEKFLAEWPIGSAAYASYWNRIRVGPSYRMEQADRSKKTVTPPAASSVANTEP
jgi:hypothetical protein